MVTVWEPWEVWLNPPPTGGSTTRSWTTKPPHLATVAKAVHKAIRHHHAGRTVLVRCRWSRERYAMVVALALVELVGIEPTEAVRLLRRRHTSSVRRDVEISDAGPDNCAIRLV